MSSQTDAMVGRGFLGRTVTKLAMMEKMKTDPSAAMNIMMKREMGFLEFGGTLNADCGFFNDWENWRLYYSMKRASERPGNFNSNLLDVEMGKIMAEKYLEDAEDTRWLNGLKKFYSGCTEHLKKCPACSGNAKIMERKMIEDGYY